MSCRHCGQALNHVFVDLGFAPPSNAYLTKQQLDQAEMSFPLKVYVCTQCWLVQTKDYTHANELFTDSYAYFSSTSSGWLTHAKQYFEMIVEKLDIDQNSFVIEIASNDGYLLKNFTENNIPCLGIEPTNSTAQAAIKAGIPVLQEFFGERLADQLTAQGKKTDLIIANNVLAHVPDINDFTQGIQKLLKPEGTVTFEFPHLMQLIDFCQFDTIYHEHFSYLSLCTVQRVFKKAGLRVYHIEELPTHGGSLRVYVCHQEAHIKTDKSVECLRLEELKKGMESISYYEGFHSKVEKIKNDLLLFLIEKKNNKELVVAYGAAAKGNTLLNYAGIKSDLLPVVYDAAESKQGKYLPGSHIEIQPPESMLNESIDYVLILPWNIKNEVKIQIEKKALKLKFVTAIPFLSIL